MSLSSSNGILSKILNGSGNRSSQRSDNKLFGVSSAEDKDPSLVLMFPINKAPMKRRLSSKCCFIMISDFGFLVWKVETKVLGLSTSLSCCFL